MFLYYLCISSLCLTVRSFTWSYEPSKRFGISGTGQHSWSWTEIIMSVISMCATGICRFYDPFRGTCQNKTCWAKTGSSYWRNSTSQHMFCPRRPAVLQQAEEIKRKIKIENFVLKCRVDLYFQISIRMLSVTISGTVCRKYNGFPHPLCSCSSGDMSST